MSLFNTLSKVALAGLIALLCVGCDGRKEVAIAAKDDTIRKDDALIAQERADNEKLEETNKALADQNTQLAEKNAAIAAKNAAETEAMRRELADDMKNLNDQMAKLKPGQGLAEGQNMGGYKDKDGSIHILVASQVLFDSGKADLKSSSHQMLLKVAQTIKSKYHNNPIRIEGHTDSTPVVHNKDKFKDNMDLSIARSRAVYDFLIKDGGLSVTKMFTAGFGEQQPIIHPEKTAADRAKNRRVEIVIMPTDVKVQKDQLAKK